MPAEQPEFTNRLIEATSPYLLQHAHNPVDWYEWGPEALRRARDEDKPIFLSIGYSACHWCHVMAHECFESRDIAALMNDYFVNIKVDREERPDLDDIYMQATMVFTKGHGGWPMSVWLTPELKPFFAGTYFPPEDRYGRPGFQRLCGMIDDAWRDKRDELEKSAGTVTEALVAQATAVGDPADPLEATHLREVARTLAQHFDSQTGGMLSGGSNKFPPSMAIELMLRAATREPSDSADRDLIVQRVRTTLDHMAAGGIRDHLAGGFARYSTDPEWHVPHFEKMLYDQALISDAYLDAHLFTGDDYYARIARDVFDFVLREMRSAEGGLYSAYDADSEGEEGKFYVWTREEIGAVLGDAAPLFCDYFDVREKGNWQDPHAPGIPKNVLRTRKALSTAAHEHGVEVDAARALLNESREKLRVAREGRPKPGLDDKVLAEWNGLMIASLARGGAVLNEPRYIAGATAAADFILTHQQSEGRLLRAWRDGRKLETAFLTDYAALVDGLIELYEATFSPRWLQEAKRLMLAAMKHFWDPQQGGFFFTADDHEALITREKDVTDNAIPSGNSLMLMNLLRLSAALADDAFAEKAQQMLQVFAGRVRERVGAAERFFSGVDFALGPVREVVIVGGLDDPRTQALLRAVRGSYTPNRVVLQRDPDVSDDDLASPLLVGRNLVDGAPAAYVCENRVCGLPITDADALRQELHRVSAE